MAIDVMRIADLAADDPRAIEHAAGLLVDGFAETGSQSWRTRDEALKTVREALDEGRICRAAWSDHAMLGWIGAISSYSGHAWELHPVVVDPSHRNRGIGRALVLDLEEQVRRRGGETVFLGTDDEDGRTSIGGVDLYPDVLRRASEIRNLRRHPFEFYRKLGYAIVGVVPDANGFGKPDILMAKRVAARPC